MVPELVTLPTKKDARAAARQVALDLLSGASALSGSARRALSQPRVHFVYLHDIPRAEEPGLRDFVRFLAKSHAFLSHDAAVTRILNGPIDKPYVSFSFDDGFKSNVQAARILEEFGATGCFFVPPGFIDSRLPTSDAMRAFGFTKGTHESAMSWDDLEELKGRGHQVENHTMNHKTLSGLSAQEVFDEISGGAERIREVLGDCQHFAWPRGRFRHFNADAAAAVFDSGHVSCSSAERGSHVAEHHADPRLLCIRRDHEMTVWPQRHRAYFVARSSRRAHDSMNNFPEHWEIPRD